MSEARRITVETNLSASENHHGWTVRLGGWKIAEISPANDENGDPNPTVDSFVRAMVLLSGMADPAAEIARLREVAERAGSLRHAQLRERDIWDNADAYTDEEKTAIGSLVAKTQAELDTALGALDAVKEEQCSI